MLKLYFYLLQIALKIHTSGKNDKDERWVFSFISPPRPTDKIISPTWCSIEQYGSSF